MLKGLLQYSLVHTTKNVDALVLEGTAAKEIASILHLSPLFPSDFLVFGRVLDADVVESILADLNRFKPLISVSIVASNDVDIFVSNVHSCMSNTSNIKF